MPAKRIARPRPRAAHIGSSVADVATDRALGELGVALSRVEARGQRSSTVVDLAIGANRVTHGLGRIPKGANVTPTVADASFAWAMTAATDRTVTITVIGAAQPGAGIEVY